MPSLIGDIVDGIIERAVTKAVQGLVTKGEITAVQAPVLIAGIMVEVQVAGEMYQASQAKSQGS